MSRYSLKIGMPLAMVVSLLGHYATAVDDPVPVTIDTFVRAETDRYFGQRVEQGCLGEFCHDRQPTAVDEQPVIRMNRDTPYSLAIFDLTTPVTIVKPDVGERFQSIVVINQDHYILDTIYQPGSYTFTQDDAGTRYIQINIRTFVDPNEPADVDALHAAQDAVEIRQEDKGSFEVPNWDQDSLTGLRKAILSMSAWTPDSLRMFGTPEETSEVRHLIGKAGGFGGDRESDAVYIPVYPEANDGETPHTLTVKDVPVDGFWSIIVYNADGFFEEPADAVSVNNVTADRDDDGSVTVHFGGDETASNYLRIMPGWNYMVRLYQPGDEIFSGDSEFPIAERAK